MSRSVAITVGNFDGVHSGHRVLLTAARHAVGADGRLIVLAFDPHPSTVLRPDAASARLTSFQRRIELLREAGADEVLRLEPTRSLLAMQPETFIADLVQRYRPTIIVEGPGFRFGHARAGSVQTLRDLQGRFGYLTAVIGPVEASLSDQHVVRVSSTMVRWLVQRGRMFDAATLLGRPYELIGPVVRGDRRGRTFDVPTANLDHGECLLPADGIYAGTARHENGAAYPAAISVGTKPTFGDRPRSCEAHLIGYDGALDDYGWTLHLEIRSWLRDQIRYDDAGALVRQLKRDISRAAELCDTSIRS